MKQRIIVLCLSIFTICCGAQQKVKTYNEAFPGGFKIFADNLEYASVTVMIDYNLQNMKSTLNNNAVLVPARTKRYLIDSLTIQVKTQKSSYNMETTIYLGDISNAAYDKEFVYHLPFSTGKAIVVNQGYNGNFSHKNINAIDFDLMPNSNITAARSGTVIEVVSNFNYGCPEERCKESANYITIMHDDGTFANYVHLKINGSLVKPGDLIKQDQIIGYSGNTGWSSAPHLHFSVFKYNAQGQQTLETYFLIAKKIVAKLNESKTYLKDY